MRMHASNSTPARPVAAAHVLRRTAARVALVGLLAVPVLGSAAATATVALPKLGTGMSTACILCVGGTKV